MKNKIVVSLIFIMIVLFSFQYVVKATNNNEDEWWYYRSAKNGVLAYKQINAFQLTLADGSTLADGRFSADSGIRQAISKMKGVDIMLVIDNSGSMKGTKIEATKKAAKELVRLLLGTGEEENNFKESRIRLGMVCFDDDIIKTVGLTANKKTLNEAIDLMYEDGGTIMSNPLARAFSMLGTNENQSEYRAKVICTLSDGCLDPEEEKRTTEIFNKIHEKKIPTLSIFIQTPITPAFAALSEEYHKNYHTDTSGLAYAIVDQIYYQTYVAILMLARPTMQYGNINGAAVIQGDNKIIMQMDDEILHGATLKIEYDICVINARDVTRIKLTDLHDRNLIFNQNERLLTESRSNSYYGWEVKNGELINETGNIPVLKEHKLKLVLSTVLTPTNKPELENILGINANRVIKIDEEHTFGDTIEIGKEEENKIEALKFLIIPPTGEMYMLIKDIIIAVNITIIVVLIALLIFAIKKHKQRKNK